MFELFVQKLYKWAYLQKNSAEKFKMFSKIRILFLITFFMSKALWAAGAGAGASDEPEILTEDDMRRFLAISLGKVAETIKVAQSSTDIERTSENFNALNFSLGNIFTTHKTGRGMLYGFFNLLDFSLKPERVWKDVQNKSTRETEKRFGNKYLVDKFTYNLERKKWDRSPIFITIWDDATGLLVPAAEFDGYQYVFYHTSIMSAFYESLKPLLELHLKRQLTYVREHKESETTALKLEDCISPDGNPENTNFFRIIEKDKAEIIGNMAEGPDCFLSNLQKLINRLPLNLRGNSIFIPTEMWPILGLDEETLVKLNSPSLNMAFFQKHVFLFRAMRIISRFRKDWMTCVVNTLIPARTFKGDSLGIFFPKAESTPMETLAISDFEDSDVENAPTQEIKGTQKKPKELRKKEPERKVAREKGAQEKLRQEQAEKRRIAAELKAMREEEKHQRDFERIIQEQAEKEIRTLEKKAR
jgi:hypothetical protein